MVASMKVFESLPKIVGGKRRSDSFYATCLRDFPNPILVNSGQRSVAQALTKSGTPSGIFRVSAKGFSALISVALGSYLDPGFEEDLHVY